MLTSSRCQIQTPGSEFQIQGSFQHSEVLSSLGGQLLTHSFGSPWALKALWWRFQIKAPNSSCLIWTALDSGCLKPPGWGEEQAYESAALLCPSRGVSGSFLWSVQP